VKKLAIVGAAALAAVASSGAASVPAASVKIVFTSAQPMPGQPSGDEIYSLDTATGRIRDASRSSGDETAPAPSPDGGRIAFARRSSTGTGALWLMRSDGTGKRRLADLNVLDYNRIQEIAWSPDGTRIAFSAARPDGTDVLWAVDADGSGLRQLTDFFAHAPSWSPNGLEIAFSAGGDPTSGRIGVVAPDGTGLRWLTGPGSFSDTQPAWSPDGARVAFFRTTGATCQPSCGSSNLFVVGADGTDARQVTAYLPGVYPPIVLDAPAWSPNGRLLAFFKDGNGGHLDLVRADGSGLRTLAKHAYAPASWSPRGNRLAFGQQRGNLSESVGYWRLTVQPLAGRARRFALGSASSPVLGGPFWRGRTLVFESVVTDTDFELFSAGPRGGGLRRLTHDRVDEFEPAWSPDGKRIAFVRGAIKRDTLRVERGSLYVMDAAGRHVRRLTRGSLDTGPSWEPGGKRIAFVRDGSDLAVLDLVTRRIGSVGVGTDSEPAWSPDGGLIAFGQGTKLEVIRPNGTRERVLFDGGDQGEGVPAKIGRPSWSPDGRSIAFDLLYDHGRWTDESEVIVTRTGQEVRHLLCYPPSPPFEPEYDHTGFRLAWSPDGQWLAVDGLAVCRVDGSDGYWLRPGDDPSWLAPRR